MCCSPNHEAVRAATHYHTRAWQTLIYGKECYIVIVIYLPSKHKQFQIILFNCMQKCPPSHNEAYNEFTPDWWQSKTSILSTNVDQKYLETDFSIAISRPTGDHWQSKTLEVAISDPGSSIVKKDFDCRISGMETNFFFSTEI